MPQIKVNQVRKLLSMTSNFNLRFSWTCTRTSVESDNGLDIIYLLAGKHIMAWTIYEIEWCFFTCLVGCFLKPQVKDNLKCVFDFE